MAGGLLLLALLAAGPAQDVAVRVTDTAVQVRWTTAEAAVCRVEYGPTEALGSAADEDPSSLRGSTNARQPGTGFAANHRADLPRPTVWPLRYRISGKTEAGVAFSGPVETIAAPKAPAGSVARESVPIRIDPGDWKLANLPVTLGLPFAPGKLADAEHVRVLAGERELPAQATVVTRWLVDDSVKWLRVRFTAPAAARDVRLEYGRQVQRAAAPELPASLGPNLLTVAGRTHAWPSLVLTDEQGRRGESVPGPVEVEEHGPAAVVLRQPGRFRGPEGDSLAYVLRAYAFAGIDAVRLDVTLENDRTGTEFARFRSAELVWPLKTGAVKVGDGAETVTLADGQRVLQREDFEWVTEPAGAKGKRLAGVIEAPGLRVAVRNFWEQYPAAVAKDAGALRIGLYPALPDGFYANRKDEDKLYYALRTGQYEFRQGFAKTHYLWLDPGTDAADRTLAGDPPTAAAPPEWIEATGALRQLAVAVRDRLPGFDERIRALADGYRAERDKAREYGLMNFGDWYGERTWNWGNLEYDLGHALLDEYARTGYAPLYHRAVETLRHQGDVDTRHYASDPKRVGQQWIHSMGHTAGYYPRDYKGMELYSSPGWSDNRGHVWAQGLYEHYLLGGDRRSWETARLISDWAAGPQTTHFAFGNAREPGWMTILVMSAFNATEDPYYLNAARIMLREVHKQSLASGDHGFYYHVLPPGHCDCKDTKHSGEAGFMLGVLMTGTKMYYERTGDETLADDLVKTARFAVDSMYDPTAAAFRYTPCPRTSPGATSTFILLEGLAFACQRSGDARLTEVTRAALENAWSQLPRAGKAAGYTLCALPQGLDTFARLPGYSLAERLRAAEAYARNPVRRPLPTNLPNPDFATGTTGWLLRAGVTADPSTTERHGGAGSLHLTAQITKPQNEYLVTRYDQGNDPYELTWFKPGERYRLTGWVKVVSLSDPQAAPSMRLAFRDADGTRDATPTNTYDLARLGTWQKLTADLTVPAYTTRCYLALNTNTREPLNAELYLADLSLVRLPAATQDAYAYLRLDPADATLAPGAKLERGREADWWTGGAASWRVTAPAAASYVAWLRVDGPAGKTARVVVGGQPLSAKATGEPAWVRLGVVKLPAGEQTVTVTPDAGVKAGRLVLTDDPS